MAIVATSHGPLRMEVECVGAIDEDTQPAPQPLVSSRVFCELRPSAPRHSRAHAGAFRQVSKSKVALAAWLPLHLHDDLCSSLRRSSQAELIFVQPIPGLKVLSPHSITVVSLILLP
jgi:hypothetical protein